MIPPRRKPSLSWSPEQKAIFEYARTGTGNLVVEAFAGTGKTTTVKEMFAHCPERRILYAVFGKRNQKEAEAKIKDSRVEVKTLHSLGYAFIKRVWNNAKPDDNVEYDRVLTVAPHLQEEEVAAVVKLVGFAKNTTIKTTLEDLAKICEEQDIELTADYQAIALRAMELAKTRDPAGRISFNDMVWLPVAMEWVRPWFELVCVDECQDMNLPQLMMARQAVKAGGRIVVVGDNRQAIFGFRGAVNGAMAMMRVTLRAKTLGLTITYRCPKLVVAEALSIVPDYKAAPSAPEGSVTSCTEFAMIGQLTPGDAVLSRLNAPLMPLALALLRKNIPARIEGKDLGKQLVGMVKSMRARSVPHFIERVEAWADKQRARLQKAKNADKKIEQVNDIAATLSAIAEGASGVSDIERKILSLFQDTEADSKPAVVLSSVHKAKGLEWRRVFLLSGTFRRGKGIEEDNIYYVAVTRAMASLFFVAGSGAPAEAAPTVTTTPEPTNVPEASQEAPVNRELPVPASKPDAYNLPVGLVLHQVGNVILFNGFEYVCEMVNECRARFVLLSKSTRADDDGQTVKADRVESLANHAEPGDILRRMSQDELTDFLTRGARRVKGEGASAGIIKKQTTESDNSMAKSEHSAVYGRAEFIKGLKDKATPKVEAWKATVEKYGWGTEKGKAYFDNIWDKKAKAEKPAKAEKVAAKVPARKTATPVAAKKVAAKVPARKPATTKKATAPIPPPRRKAAAPVMAAPAPAATPAAEAPAAPATTQEAVAEIKVQ